MEPVALKWSGCVLGKAARQLTQELTSTWTNLAVRSSCKYLQPFAALRTLAAEIVS